jgi:uncharacterized protein (DUF1800 family)
MNSMRRRFPVFAAFVALLPGIAGPVQAAINPADLLWLDRVTYGANGSTIEQFRRAGRRHYLSDQLRVTDAGLPAAVAAQVKSLHISSTNARQLLAEVNLANQQINGLTDEAPRQAARKILNDSGNQLAYEAARRHLLYAIYSPAQLREQLVWFWLNHFSVYQAKGNIRWLVGDYEAQAIRPNATGKFRDLVLATLRHPAMLQYLDNAQNAAGRVNENYARELMELHTLGVNAGYSQQDVQELARILTGVGINASDVQPRLKPEWQQLYVHEGAFEFNPVRHDFGAKTLLGRRFEGGGMAEVEAAVDWLVSQPACARFISTRLAQYFLGAEPSPQLLQKLTASFQHSHGDIAAVLAVLLESREFDASLGKAFKDPMHYVVSSIRVAYEGRTIVNVHPVVNWLNTLGEPLYGRQTPDGYPLLEANWASSGQLGKRFEVARAIGAGNAGLFASEDGTPAGATGFPQLASRYYFEWRESLLSSATRAALDQAGSQLDWNTYLLSSPEFNYR